MDFFNRFLTELKTNQWCVGVSGWIIQDGSYEDFKKNQYTEFALEFYSKNLQPTNIQKKIAEPSDPSKFYITGEVVYLSSDHWVLDFGIYAYSEDPPPEWASLHSFVTGEISLGIDVCGCSGIHELPQAPALIYSWNIDRIYDEKENFLLEVEQMDTGSDPFLYYHMVCTKLDAARPINLLMLIITSSSCF